MEWLFRGWLLARTLLWTLVATLTQHAPPLDTVEWLCWGREWQLGYYKHPPLAAWVAEVAYRLTPGSFFGVYFAGYLAIALALWCVWQLARSMLSPRAALAATICLDGLLFFGQAAAEFNNQVLLIAFWALAVLLFHRALADDRWRDWIGTGLALGLALLCKYSAVFLIVPLLGLWLWRNGPRRPSRPLVVALTAALIFLPHFVWLCRNDFPTLRYAALRAQGETESYDHRFSAITFLLSQGLRLLPVALVLLPLLSWRRRNAHNPEARAKDAGVPRSRVGLVGEGASLDVGWVESSRPTTEPCPLVGLEDSTHPTTHFKPEAQAKESGVPPRLRVGLVGEGASLDVGWVESSRPTTEPCPLVGLEDSTHPTTHFKPEAQAKDAGVPRSRSRACRESCLA